MLGLFRYHDTLHDSICMASDGGFFLGFYQLFIFSAYSFFGGNDRGTRNERSVAKLGNELFASFFFFFFIIFFIIFFKGTAVI